MDKLMDIAETAEALGLSVPGVYGLVFKKKIPVIRISKKCIRFRPSDIEKWLAEKSQDVLAEILPVREKRTKQKKGSGIETHIDRLVENAKKDVLE